MYAMKCEELKGRGKVRSYSGLFSMGALAIALSACGSGDFKLAEKDVVKVDGNKVTLTFTADPKSADSTKIKVDGTALAKDKATVSGKTVVIDLGTTKGNDLKITFDAGGLKGSDDKDYTTALTIDNKLPSATGQLLVSADSKVIIVVFDEKITAVDETKFSNTAGGAVVSAKVSETDSTYVEVTFEKAASGILTIAAGAVTDDAASQSNTEGLQNTGGSITFDSDTTPPVLADGDSGTTGTQSLTVNSANTVLTVTFDEAITGKVDASIVVKQGSTTKSGGTIATSGSTVTITFTGTLDAAMYTVEIASGGVTSAGGATTTNLTTSVVDIPPSLDDDLVGLGVTSDADYGF